MAHRLRDVGGMGVLWRRAALVGLGAIYLVATGFLAGLVTERIRVDRDRREVIRAQERRAREARTRAIRIELQQEAEQVARER